VKTLKSGFLLLIIITSIGLNATGYEDYSETKDRKIEHLSAFAKLYGYIRYFHPSDEAASIDWNNFLYHGIGEVVKAKDAVDLVNTLDSLFLPIAPSIDIFFSEETLEAFDQPENTDSLVLVAWQHKGVAADPNPVFKSIRLNRLNWAVCSRLGVFQQFSSNFDCGNKKFKLSAKVRTSRNGKGEIEVFGYAPTGKYYHRSETFENEELVLTCPPYIDPF